MIPSTRLVYSRRKWACTCRRYARIEIIRPITPTMTEISVAS
jgi:hypothetical protein